MPNQVLNWLTGSRARSNSSWWVELEPSAKCTRKHVQITTSFTTYRHCAWRRQSHWTFSMPSRFFIFFQKGTASTILFTSLFDAIASIVSAHPYL